LGFLLITFFIFTATMSTPNTTKLNMPKKEEDKTKEMEVVKSGLLTILLGKDNVYYYEGELQPDGSNFMTSSFPTPQNPGIRKVIQDKRAQVIAAHTHNEACKKIWNDNNGDQNSCLDRDLVVVIKPDINAKYGRAVDILDEMNINGVQRYALIEIAPQEQTVLELARQKNQGQ
jgi:biopolymer transport protein ExbD